MYTRQILLDLARGLFEETASLDAMMTQVMKEAQELIPCEHCTVVILDQEDKEVRVHVHAQSLLFSHVYTCTCLYDRCVGVQRHRQGVHIPCTTVKS